MESKFRRRFKRFARKTPSKKFKRSSRKSYKRPRRVFRRFKQKFHQAAIKDAGGSSFSFFNYGQAAAPKIALGLYAVSPNIQLVNHSSCILVNTGFQNALSVNCMFGGSNAIFGDLSTMYSHIAGGNTTNRMFLMNCSGELLITNPTNSGVRAQIYDIVCKRDVDSRSIGDPVVAWTQGISDESSGSYDKSVIGALPYSSALFCDFFTVKKVTHLMLNEGQSHVHRFRYTPNKFLCEELNTYETTNIRGVTCYQMIVLYGMPADASNTTVTSTACKLDIIAKMQYRYKWISDVSTNLYANNNLATTGTLSTMDIGSGTAHGVVEA